VRPESIMIFAAGFGTRMGGLTRDQPKALIEVGGRPLLDRTLTFADGAGLTRQVVNAHYLADQIEAHLGRRDIRVSREEPQILDTGGGLKAALPILGDNVVVTSNSDAVWSGPNPFDVLLAAWDPDRMEALLLLVPLIRAIGRIGGGDFTLESNDRLIRKGDQIYSGVQVLKTDRVAQCREDVFSLNRIWDEIATEGGLFGTVYPGKWCDVGHSDGLALAEFLLSQDTDV